MQPTSTDLKALERVLGYRFESAELLQQAVTHRSAAGANNERLEFLGDSLVNFVVAEALYRARPRAEEGALSRLRASLVREETLAELARKLALGDHLRLGEGELRSGGWRRDSVLADAFEAVMGAVLLDAGFERAKVVCMTHFGPLMQHLPDPESLKDPKTRLQEWLQAANRPLPIYEVLEESGPPHRRRFVVQVSLGDADQTEKAEGTSRRGAQQAAADRLLQRLQA